MASHHIDKLKKEFFYKNISIGYHNCKYSQNDIINSIIQACKNKETFGEYCRTPDSDTIYRRLKPEIPELLKQFQSITKDILKYLWKKYPRERWEILVDCRDKLFYGKKGDEYVIGTKDGKKCFRFLHINVVCKKFRLTYAILPIKKGSNIVNLMKPIIEQIISIIKPFNFYADAGFASGAFIQMIQQFRLPYVIRIKSNGDIGRYIDQGKTSEIHYYTLLNGKRIFFHAKFGKKDTRKWALATSHYRTQSNHLWDWYSDRWEIENGFKTQDRVELKTCSRFCKMRLFSQMVTALLYIFWNLWRIISSVYYTIKQFVRIIFQKIILSTRSKILKIWVNGLRIG